MNNDNVNVELTKRRHGTNIIDERIKNSNSEKTEKDIDKASGKAYLTESLLKENNLDANSYRPTRRARESYSTARTQGRYRSRNNNVENTTTFTEKIVMQCIVSGVILASVLALNLIDTEKTQSLKATLRQEISQNISFEKAKTVFNNTVSSAKEMSNSLSNVFGFEENQTDIENNINTDQNTKQNIEAEPIEVIEPQVNEVKKDGEINTYTKEENVEAKDLTQNVRIDEDILNEIGSQEDVYGTEKK